MLIEIWSDIMCPFCYIGKRKLEKALEQFKHSSEVKLEWKSFQLDPTISDEITHQSVYEYIAARKGWTLDRCKEIHKTIVEMAADVGLKFDFDKAKMANSFTAHRIIQYAKTKGLGDAAEEQFFKAYFTDGKNLNSRIDLTEVGIAAGLTYDAIDDALTNDRYADAVKADIGKAERLGIHSVPFFVFNRKYAISGAQPVAVFSQTLEKAFEEWKTAQPIITYSTLEGDACCKDGDCTL